MSLELDAKLSRMRTRFVKMCAERLTEIDEFRASILEKYGKRDEDGNLIKEKEKGFEIFTLEDKESFYRDLDQIMREEFIVDELEERKDMLLGVKDAVLNVDRKFSGQEAMEYDRWCEIVEQINY